MQGRGVRGVGVLMKTEPGDRRELNNNASQRLGAS